MQTPDNDNRETDRTTDQVMGNAAEQAGQAPPKALSPAALRALQEAEERRANEARQEMPAEVGGRGGADPARFGDWEINGRAIDF